MTPSPPSPPPPASPPCRDYNPKADEGYHSPVWHDAVSSQYTCVQYRTGVNTQTGVGWCEAYGRDERYRNFGKTAAEACCACDTPEFPYDGGVREVPPSPPEPPAPPPPPLAPAPPTLSLIHI